MTRLVVAIFVDRSPLVVVVLAPEHVHRSVALVPCFAAFEPLLELQRALGVVTSPASPSSRSTPREPAVPELPDLVEQLENERFRRE